jgi:hypothetical protein
MSNDVIFLEITPSKDQDLQANYNVSPNLGTHPRDWIGMNGPCASFLKET